MPGKRNSNRNRNRNLQKTMRKKRKGGDATPVKQRGPPRTPQSQWHSPLPKSPTIRRLVNIFEPSKLEQIIEGNTQNMAPNTAQHTSTTNYIQPLEKHVRILEQNYKTNTSPYTKKLPLPMKQKVSRNKIQHAQLQTASAFQPTFAKPHITTRKAQPVNINRLNLNMPNTVQNAPRGNIWETENFNQNIEQPN